MEKRVEFLEPAQFWTEALPLGNGRLGAMVWGGIVSEFIQLNEDTLWSGGPKDWNNPKAAESLETVQNLVWQGRYTEASKLAQSNMLGPDEGQVYQPLGDITVNFGESHNTGFVEVGSYTRVLDLDTALAHTSYKLLPQAGEAAGIAPVEYTRETFVSHADQVVAMSVSASKPASVSCVINLDSQLPSKVSILDATFSNMPISGNEYVIGGIATYNQSISSQRIILEGRCPGNVSMRSVHSKEEIQYDLNSSGMKFSAVLEIRALGNSASFSMKSANHSLERQGGFFSTGVTQTAEVQLVSVEHADSVVLLVAAASSYDGPFKDPTIFTTDPISKCLAHLDSIANVSYATFLTRHLQDYQPLFRRVALELASSEQHQAVDTARTAIPTATGLSTKDRVGMFAENEDPMLVALLFNFGRYLMLASSRPGSLATNLQGIWNANLHPTWGCTPHTNINLQMNYWPAELCNLAECHEPLFDLISVLATNGIITAKVNYNKRGWVAHHIVDVWGLTAPCSGDPVYALWPMGGAWLCTHLWEHYLYSLDKEFLAEVAFPLMKGCVDFLLDWLVDLDSLAVRANPCLDPSSDGGDHNIVTCTGDSSPIVYLVTNPSTSPEHNFITSEGQQASVSYATTMDMAIIRENLSAILSAAHVLEDRVRVDDEFLQRVVDANNRLLPPQIGDDGLLMEWALPFQDPEVTHRHMSHLFGLYPGHTLSLQTTPALCNAASQSIIKRGKVGPGWSTAWKIALWARLWNGTKAYEMVKQVFTLVDDTQTDVSIDGGGLYANLFCAHPPFQIDGNFGITAAIAEMLIQSDGENVYLLPAVGEKWTEGEVCGLRARGGVHVSKLRWQAGKMDEVRVEFVGKGPTRDEALFLHYNTASTKIEHMTVGTLYIFDGALVAKSIYTQSSD